MYNRDKLTPEQIKCVDRWYPLIPHPEQLRLIESKARFKVVPAGRRSGKTERAKRFIVKYAMQNANESLFIAAPTHAQVKKIYWNDIKTLSFASVGGGQVYESELYIKLANGSCIYLIGLDKPERIEGIFWTGGIIDEIADIKAGAWEENISPALDTYNPLRPDYRPWCWLIGVPDGLNHYYDMAEKAKLPENEDWELFTWLSSDILPADIIEGAKRRLSPRQFKQEYEASFETATGKIYEDYSAANYTDSEIQEHEQLLWMHDFNFTPMSSAIGVLRKDKDGVKKDLYILDEIVLESAIARQTAIEFCERYKNHKNKHVLLFGDPAGRAGEKHGHASDYTEIEQVLRDKTRYVLR